MRNLMWIAFAIGWAGVTWAQSGPRKPPNYSQSNMPITSFSCRDKILGGYYADPETDCQMFHVCVKVPGQGIQDYKFLCPNDTSFDQENQICDDWFNIDCEAGTLYYSDNFDLYRIGSDYDSGRVSPGVKLPTNNINNAVSDSGDDDYLRRADKGESVGNDLLRGSHSSNFFSNKNQGREDDDDVKTKATTGKSGVRKLLTGKRPLGSTTSAAPPPTQGTPVDSVTQRQNYAGRNRGASNFRGGFRSNPTTFGTSQPAAQFQQQQPTVPAEPQRLNYNTAAPSTQRPNYYSTVAPVTQRQNYYTNAQTQKANYFATPSTTQRPNSYTTSAPTSVAASRQNYYTAAPSAQTQRQNYYSSPATQQAAGASSFPAANQNQYYNPSTQNQGFNYQTTMTARNFQNYQTTPTPGSYSETSKYDPTNDFNRATHNAYETAKLYKLNIAAQNNNYNANYNNDKFDEGSSGEFLKTAPSQNLGAANFNRIQNIYKGYNTSVAASYNTESTNATAVKPASNNYNNYATINRNTFANTSPKPNVFNNQYSTSYNQEQTYSTVAPNYYSQSTTQKPFVQNSYNGTTAARNAFFTGASAVNTQNTYPTTQYNYYTSTTQKPSSQNYYQPSQQYTQSSPNYYAPSSTEKPASNFYNPSAPAQTTYYNDQGTTKAQNYNQQPAILTKAAVQKPANQKKYNAPATNFSPNGVASSPTPFASGNRGTFPVADKTEKPRPFTSTASPSKSAPETKSEKDQYDYAYYDDATHVEYDSLDTVEFVKTKSKTRSRK